MSRSGQSGDTRLRLIAVWQSKLWRLSVLALGVASVSLASQTLPFSHGSQARASGTPEERKLPMKFAWNSCAQDCTGWVSAIGIVTADTPRQFDEFARARDLSGSAIVLDSSGGSVNDALALGRRWRKLNLTTSVGTTVTEAGRPSIRPDAYCESMCVFLMLSGQTRYVPDAARVRVHQIWMGDRAEDARAATYTAQDLTIVERDIGRLAKYTFDMGGTGDLLSLALSVPPWEDLHRLSSKEMQAANLLTTLVRPITLPGEPRASDLVATAPKSVQERFVSQDAEEENIAASGKATKTAEAHPTGKPVTSATQQ